MLEKVYKSTLDTFQKTLFHNNRIFYSRPPSKIVLKLDFFKDIKWLIRPHFHEGITEYIKQKTNDLKN